MDTKKPARIGSRRGFGAIGAGSTARCLTPRRGSTSRHDCGLARFAFTSACRGDWSPRRLWAPEIAGSTPAGQIRRSLATPTCLRRRGVAVPASLMSSRPWVRIPPALLHWGRSSAAESTRLSGEHAPVRVRSSPLSAGKSGRCAAMMISRRSTSVSMRAEVADAGEAGIGGVVVVV